MHLPIQIEKNLRYEEGSESEARYFFHVDLSGALPGEGRVARLPVFWRPNRARHPLVKEIYSTRILGTTLEKANLAALENVIPSAVEAVIDYGTLPYYLLSYPLWAQLPIYLTGGKLSLRLPEGPTLTGEDMGRVYHKLHDYLLDIGKLNSKDDLEVSLVLWKDLQIYPMALAFANGKAWIPIFVHLTSEGLQLNYDVIGVPSRFLELGGVFDLRREIAASLVSTRALSSPFDLNVEQIREDVWEALQRWAKPTPYVLTYFGDSVRLEIQVYEAGGEVFALDRASKTRLIFSSDLDELSRRMSNELSRARRLPGAALLTLERAGA